MKITPHKADCQRYNGVMKAVITPEIAENLHQVGDRWTLLILRDLFLGRNRFETLKAKTGAGRATLTRRLQSLIAADIVGKSLYSAGRYEYHLTTKGRDLFPAAMLAWQWEIKHLPIIEGELPPSLVHSDCGNPFEPIATCEACNQPLLRGSVALMPDTLSFDRQVWLPNLKSSAGNASFPLAKMSPWFESRTWWEIAGRSLFSWQCFSV